MDFGVLLPFLQVIVLFILVVEVAVDWVEVVSLPVSLGCFRFQDLLVRQQFLVVMLKVFVRNNIVVSKVLPHIYRDFFL